MPEKIHPVQVKSECSQKRLWKSISSISTGNVYPLIPVTQSLLPLLFLASSFAVGITGNHGISKTPYPSDLGDYQPERGLFTLSLSIDVSLTFQCIIFRYIQMVQYGSRRNGNLFSVICGILSVLGQCLVFSFSQLENKFGHFFGAFLYFLFGVLYIVMQTQFSRRFNEYHPKFLIWFRGMLAILGIIVSLIFFPSRLFAPEDESRYYIPQVCEWLIGAIFNVFFFTFAYDFNGLKCTAENMFVEKEYSNEKMQQIIQELEVTVDKRKKERELKQNNTLQTNVDGQNSEKQENKEASNVVEVQSIADDEINADKIRTNSQDSLIQETSVLSLSTIPE